MAKYDFSPNKQKIVLLLLAGATLSLSHNPRTHWYIIKSVPKALKDINRKVLYRIMKEFYYERLIDFKNEKDGSYTMTLTDRGEKYALRFKIDEMEISKPTRWDNIWRLVIFDIPEKQKKAREALRDKLKELGFEQIQKSVWVYPYKCKNEINFIVEVFEIRQHVHYIEAKTISNDSKLKLIFNLK
jgi:CRISPR-associated endonuclease Cas2